ncbi:MAG: GSCFA domain-containing protein [Pseudomonadota bacterium]
MPDCTTALRQSKENPLARWTGAEGSAQERLDTHLCIPEGRQSFMSGPDESFFAIGSCFARNVEEHLEAHGMTVLSRQANIRDLGVTRARATGIFNKFNPFSMLHELQFASGEKMFDERSLFLSGRDQYYDSHLVAKSGDASLDEMMARREEINCYFAQAFDADVLILTLGLTEAWFDRETGLYFNATPNPHQIRATPDRFEFQVLSFAHCLTALREINAILDRHSKAGQKLLLTVSPVPLGRTFTTDDVIMANMTSKSTLRAAAWAFLEEASGVDYFPSYEAAQLSHPDLVWQPDRVHVSDVMVSEIIKTFLARYGIAASGNAETHRALDEETTLIKGLTRQLESAKMEIKILKKMLQDGQSKAQIGE